MYPKHSEDPYAKKPLRDGIAKASGRGGVFRPSPGPKSMPTSSIMQQNVVRYTMYKQTYIHVHVYSCNTRTCTCIYMYSGADPGGVLKHPPSDRQ